MKLRLHKKEAPVLSGAIKITGSKSESNRLLILQKLYGDLTIENLSNSDDSQVMQKALISEEPEVDVHHAGTAMRFLTAYFSIQEGRETILTGSKRMKERPIGILVKALRGLGADITYLENEGYAPLKIKGKILETSAIALDAHVSSQYISALMMIGAALPKGLTITLIGEPTSVPYIEMTRDLLGQLGISTHFENNKISVAPVQKAEKKTIVVESDWSSASYYYGLVALSEEAEVTLSSYKKESLQGDSALAGIYRKLGVETVYGETSIKLIKTRDFQPKHQKIDLVNSPDIAQTIAVTCFGMGIGCELTGLHTLKIKETDRLEALKVELSKLGANISVTQDSLHLEPTAVINPDIIIKTYQDHRMAMAFAPLAMRVPIYFEDAEVVNKSYPDFWKDLATLGINSEEV
ncbi:3-phosphoshikimate 1-carboxyvinyltransferase [Flavimarina sp. Hel_I_48]|uniref:3-phosphoshikimate 1-carboxyvinyltransferase n=1 Tax=Flavimarina sp. Hel_I_48 TaxID=1392488 RepID=UPI0004DF049F|nr:3-phosphoshikimate 1-carboxyvinyltransferase [Flavimarina sp. Hel_I_48]